MKDKSRAAFNAGAAALLVVIGAGLAGCNLAAISPAPSVSIFSGAAPVVYGLSPAPAYNVVASSVNRTKEGVVLGSTLDEYLAPTAWAVTNATNDHLYNVAVTPASDGANFLSFGGTYYAKNIQIGTGTADVRNFLASVSGSAVIYTHNDSDATKSMVLPSSALSASNQAWYWTQMAAGSYAVLDANAALVPFSGIVYTELADGSLAFSGATKANRWLTANDGSPWKSGRDAALAFIKGKILIGAASLAIAPTAGKWLLGIDDTAIASTWELKTYFPILLSAYASTGSVSTVDTVSGATSE